jgi:hypothetical protein
MSGACPSGQPARSSAAVVNDIAIAGLILDVVGALLLSRAVLFERAEDYIQGCGTPK